MALLHKTVHMPRASEKWCGKRVHGTVHSRHAQRLCLSEETTRGICVGAVAIARDDGDASGFNGQIRRSNDIRLPARHFRPIVSRDQRRNRVVVADVEEQAHCLVNVPRWSA